MFFLCMYKMLQISKFFDKCDPEKQKYRQQLTPNAEYQQCRVFVRNY